MKRSFSPWLISLAFGLMSTMVHAAPVEVTGGPSGNATDITSLLLANQDVHFNGGNFVVSLPASGSGIVEAQAVDARLSDFGSTGYSSKTNPTINYTGAISGNGVLTVQSAFNSTKPVYGQPFSGGLLAFTSLTKLQTWGVEGTPSGGTNAPALIIGPNATVAFVWPGENDHPTAAGAPLGAVFPASTTVSRNITNNGFLFSMTTNNWASITGTGVSSFAYFGGDRGSIGSGIDSYYSGESFHTANGLKIEANAIIQDRPDGLPTKLVTRGLTTFSPFGSMTLLNPKYVPAARQKVVSSNIYNWGLNIQLWWNGIHQFTGMFLPTTASKSFLETAPPEDVVKGAYSYNGGGMAFGRVINLNNRSTLMMGDGREVVTNADGVTNNVWLQGNPFNTLLSTANFVGSNPGRDAQAIAYAYSGTYRLNHNFNAKTDGKNGVILGIRNAIWTNLYLLDPQVYNPKASRPNHAVLTTTVFFGALTRIDRNAVLQLGDGTPGNNFAQKVLSFSDGRTTTYPYSDSSGNGMLITKGNDHFLTHASKATATYEIANNGKLIVNNTPGALDATTVGASAEVAAWVVANQLDGINGSGSVEQLGQLPLTLGSVAGNPNTYTGGTLIGANATLIVGSPTAFGQRDPATAATGRVVNQGTVKAASGVRTITVRGDYIQ